MKTTDHAKPDRATFSVWLDREQEGELSAVERESLAAALAAHPELAAERCAWGALHTGLAASRIAVRPHLRATVMASLPVAAWEARRFPAWVLPLAAMVLFALAAALVLGPADLSSENHVVGTTLAVAELLRATALAGAGLAAASWRGLGLGLEQLIAESGFNLVALGIFVLFVDLLFLALLRRPARATRPAASGKVGTG